MAKNCKECGTQLLASGRNRGGRALCVPCCKKHGLCTTCRSARQDRPGFLACSNCYRCKVEEGDRCFARTGSRGKFAEWQMREIEQQRALGAKLLAECLAARQPKEPLNG